MCQAQIPHGLVWDPAGASAFRLQRPAGKCLSNDTTFRLAATVVFLVTEYVLPFLWASILVNPLKTKRVHEMESSGGNQGNFIWGVGGKENRYSKSLQAGVM
jgi:hypothetical protein